MINSGCNVREKRMIRKERAFYLCVAVIIEIYDISIKGVVVLKSSLYTLSLIHI